MNYEWIGENHLEKHPIQKKNEKKTCSNTVFSLHFIIGVKKNYAAKALAFSLHFLFRRDQNNHSNLTSKIMNLC